MTVFVPVNPETLAWARENAGYPDIKLAAAALNMGDTDMLRGWESGHKKVTLTQAKKLAHKYRVSLPALYLKSVPDHFRFVPPKDFRGVGQDQSISPNLREAIAISKNRQEWAREFLQGEGKSFDKPPKIFLSEDHQSAAKKIKEWLGVPVAHPAIDWLREWSKQAEKRGMLVMQTNTHRHLKVPGKEFSGLYLADDFAPTVLLNGSDASSRRLFTLMHELTHLWLDEPGISRVKEKAKKLPAAAPIDKKTERFCENVAAAILLPVELLRAEWNGSGSPLEKTNHIHRITGASYAAILVNLEKNEIGAKADYHEVWQSMSESKRQGGGGRVIPHKQAIRRCGGAFSRLALSGYEQGLLTAIELSDMIGMRLPYLSDFASDLGFPLRGWQT